MGNTRRWGEPAGVKQAKGIRSELDSQRRTEGPRQRTGPLSYSRRGAWLTEDPEP